MNHPRLGIRLRIAAAIAKRDAAEEYQIILNHLKHLAWVKRADGSAS